MPVITGGWYTADPMRRNPDWLFLFGDNYLRTGKGGQATICRGEPNTCGIRTKWEPTKRPQAFFSDNDYKRCTAMIAADLAPAMEHVQAGGVCVLPYLGIGTGLSGLENRAPGLFRYLQHALQLLVETGHGQPLPPTIEINAAVAMAMQRLARSSHCLMSWTIWPPSSEYPECYAAEPSTAESMAPMRERMLDKKLKDLRFRLPTGLALVKPLEVESGTFVETWA